MGISVAAAKLVSKSPSSSTMLNSPAPGQRFNAALKKALELKRRRGLTFVHPYDDPDVIAGQGTIGVEILRQHPHALDAIFVPVGGGGLISGIAAYVKRVNPAVKIIGVEPVDAAAM